MPIVTLPYVPADGTALDADQINQDLYSTTPGESLYQVSNGNLTAYDNFGAAYIIFNGMLRQHDVAYAKSVGLTNSQDYVDQVWGKGEAERTIPGCSITWYQRQDASFAIANLGYFLSWWRIRGGITEQGDEVAGPSIRLYTYFDGQKTGYELFLPTSVSPSPFGGTPVDDWGINEQNLARYTNSHVCLGSVAKGWHTVSLRVRIEQNTNKETTDGTLNEQEEGEIQSQHRVRFRVRNATVLSLW